MKRTATILPLLALALFATPASAVLSQAFDADVSEWSSATVPVPGSILPIGGSGQVNGNFSIAFDTDFPNIEVALRANQRFSPIPLPNTFNQYFAQPGTSGGPGSPNPTSALGATWNYDIHIDLRGSGLSFDDFDIAFTSSIAALTTTDLQASLETLSPFLGPGDLDGVELFQTSQNALFGNLIDPLAPGDYTFDLSITPKAGVIGPQLSSAILVTVVPEPATAGLALTVLGAIACVRRR